MTKGLIYSVISALAFGTLAVLVKMAYLVGLEGMEIMAYRFVFAVVVFFLYLALFKPQALKPSKKLLLKAFFIGTFVYLAQSSLFTFALEKVPASTVILIFYLYPAIVTLLSMIFFRFKLDRTVGLSLFLVTFGCAFIFYDAFAQHMHGLGVLYAVGATLVFSFYLILCQILLKKEEPLRASFYVLFFTAISFSCFAPPHSILELNMDQLGVALALGVIPGVIAVAFLYRAIELVGSAYASLFSTLEPVATVTLAFFLLGEPLVPVQMFGAVFIIIGILLPNARLLILKRKHQTQGAVQ